MEFSTKFRGLKGLGILAGTEYPGDRTVRRETSWVTETAGKATARRETSTYDGRIRDLLQRSPVTYEPALDPRLGPESGNLEHSTLYE